MILRTVMKAPIIVCTCLGVRASGRALTRAKQRTVSLSFCLPLTPLESAVTQKRTRALYPSEYLERFTLGELLAGSGTRRPPQANRELVTHLSVSPIAGRQSPVIAHWSPSTAHRSLSPACILRHLSQNRSEGSRHMEESAKLASLPVLGEADAVPQSLFLSFPEQAKTLTLLYDISRELTAILDRETLLRSIAQHVKKLVNYHV